MYFGRPKPLPRRPVLDILLGFCRVRYALGGLSFAETKVLNFSLIPTSETMLRIQGQSLGG